MFESFVLGISTVFNPSGLLALAFGVLWGTVGGMIPGINATIAMALILPFTWSMDPATAVVMLAGIYCGGEYGGSIPAVLIGTPGTNAAACTVFDGYELHKKGQTATALYASLISSVYGGFFGAVVLIFIALPLASVALAFGPAEYFALALVGLTLICSLGEDNVLKGIWAGLLGILLSTVGFDPIAGASRLTLGSLALLDGLEMIPLMMGLFAISEVFRQAMEFKADVYVENKKTNMSLPSWATLKSWLPCATRASILGVIIGAMPGAGATVASFLSYSYEKKCSKDPDSFGKGNPLGVVAPEAANNAVTGGAMVPLLALGIPGSNSTAIMLGALMIHNVAVGPMLFINQPEIPYGIFTSLLVANLFMFIVGLVCVRFAARVANISTPSLLAVIVALVFTGSYAFSGEIFDIGLALCCGVIGIAMKKGHLPHAATVLGFVLGSIMETNLRRALILSKGSYIGAFFNSYISSALILLAVASVLWALYKPLYRSYKARTVM